MSDDGEGARVEPGSGLADAVADVEARAAHPAYRQQRRRVIGFELIDLTPDDQRPVLLCACLAEGCGALYRPGDPRMVAHHQTHRERT